MDQYRVERFREEGNAHLVCEGLINWMIAEVHQLLLFRLSDRHIVIDVLLTATLDSVIAKLEWVDSSIEQLKSISAFIHQINFCQHSNCSFSLWVDFSGNFKRVRVGEITVGWG